MLTQQTTPSSHHYPPTSSTTVCVLYRRVFAHPCVDMADTQSSPRSRPLSPYLCSNLLPQPPSSVHQKSSATTSIPSSPTNPFPSRCESQRFRTTSCSQEAQKIGN